MVEGLQRPKVPGDPRYTQAISICKSSIFADLLSVLDLFMAPVIPPKWQYGHITTPSCKVADIVLAPLVATPLLAHFIYRSKAAANRVQ